MSFGGLRLCGTRKERKMLVDFFKSITGVAAYGEPWVTRSPPQPMGENNFVDASMLPETMFDQGGGGGTPELMFQCEGSNDGQHWFPITGFTALATVADDLVQNSSTVTAAFVRFKVTLTVAAGAPGDWVAATFDLQANLSQKNG